jgi:hypothetical protein
VPHFDDTPFEDEFQKNVYQFAAREVRRVAAKRVIDMGCGSGYKLLNSFPADVELCGVEVHPTLDWLRSKYPKAQWYSFGTLLWRWRQLEPVNRRTTVLVCSDVIEHVDDPDTLLDYIIELKPDLIVLSTPDRVRLGIGTEDGPPHNMHHVREWTSSELQGYLKERFSIREVVDGKTIIVSMTIREEP